MCGLPTRRGTGLRESSGADTRADAKNNRRLPWMNRGADAIATAALNPARLKELGEGARTRAKEFSADMMVDRTEELYRRLLRGGNEEP